MRATDGWKSNTRVEPATGKRRPRNAARRALSLLAILLAGILSAAVLYSRTHVETHRPLPPPRTALYPASAGELREAVRQFLQETRRAAERHRPVARKDAAAGRGAPP